MSLALGRSQRLDQRVTKVGTRREQSRRVFICHSRCAIAHRGCPESIRPVVVMDSGLARACHRAAQSAEPLARPGMTSLRNCFARFHVFGATHWAHGALRVRADLLSRINVICPVQSCLQKYSAFPVGQITTTTAASCPTEGRCATSSTRGGMRWTRAALLTRALRCGRRSRVVLTPRRWRQVWWRQLRFATVANKPGHRGEHEVSRKPLRGECRANPV